MKFSSASLFGVFLLVMSPMAVSHSAPAVSVKAGNIFDACKLVLVKKYIDEKVSDPEAASFAADHTCKFFDQKCRTEPDGEICKKAIHDISGK